MILPSLSYLTIYNLMQVWNAQVSFHKWNFINFLREWSVFHSKPNANVIFRSWTALWNEHLLQNKIKPISFGRKHL